MTTTINRLWLTFIVPVVLVAAIGATVALAQGDDAPTNPTDTSALLHQDPTPTPDSDDATPGDGSEDDGAPSDKDCPRDGSDGSNGDSEDDSGSTTGISFRR